MIGLAARRSFENLFAPETRKVFWKVLGLTLLALLVLWFVLRGVFNFLVLPWLQGFMPFTSDWTGWLTFLLAIFAGIALALAMALLISPVTALIAGLFLDDVAEVVVENVERNIGLGLTPVEATKRAMRETTGPPHRP